MHDAKLNLGLRKDTLDGLGKAFEPVHARNEYIFDPAIFKLGNDPKPEFGAFAGGYP